MLGWESQVLRFGVGILLSREFSSEWRFSSALPEFVSRQGESSKEEERRATGAAGSATG